MDNIRNHWQWLFVLGLSTIALSTIAVIAPSQPSLKFEIWVGLIFIAAGLANALYSLWSRQWGGFFFMLFGAVHYLLVGLMLLANPGAGATMFILLLAMLFIMQGMVQFGLVSELPSHINKNWMLISATLAVTLGVLTWLQWPDNTYWLIGLFVGLHLLSKGLSMVFLALVMRQLARVGVRPYRQERTVWGAAYED